MIYMSLEKPDLDNPNNLIMDSANQLMQFRYFPNFSTIKELIKQTDLVTLETYTGKTAEELEKIRPGLVKAYDSLVVKLKEPNLTSQEFAEIMKETYKITHQSF